MIVCNEREYRFPPELRNKKFEFSVKFSGFVFGIYRKIETISLYVNVLVCPQAVSTL